MRRFNKDKKKEDEVINQDKPINEEGFSLDNSIDIELSNEVKKDTNTESEVELSEIDEESSEISSERKVARRVFDIISEPEEDLSRKRNRNYKKSSKRKDRNKNESKVSLWFNKSIFVIGRIRFSRLAVSLTLLILVILSSGFIVLATTDILFHEIIPIENEELILAKKTVYIKDGEDVELHQVYFGTVSSIIKSNEIVIGENDRITPSLETTIYNRMQIEIERAIEVTVRTNEDKQTIVMYNGTVADALKEADIDFDEDDLLEPSSEVKVSDGMEITHDVVEVIVVTEETVIEYETEYVEESTILKGYWNVKQKGKDGLAEVIYEVTYLNGEEQSRKPIVENMIKEPQNKIIMNGTGLTRAGSEGDEPGGGVDIKNPDEQSTNPSVPGTTSTYVDKVVAHVTAYTHTGSTTATGTWPRSTRTLDNPGSCAVVPDTFPYGSLLYVPGYGYCIAEDTGGFRHDPDRWNQIDVFMNTAAECITWGRKREWTVYVIRYGR